MTAGKVACQVSEAAAQRVKARVMADQLKEEAVSVAVVTEAGAGAAGNKEDYAVALLAAETAVVEEVASVGMLADAVEAAAVRWGAMKAGQEAVEGWGQQELCMRSSPNNV
mmetsp:Transcript_16630/g.42722  ORF Transcript_16630/g.42722 Transcript_16630/m.42722 type:complete len:111 (+) Transcript_16630:1453-1785(+)